PYAAITVLRWTPRVSASAREPGRTSPGRSRPRRTSPAIVRAICVKIGTVVCGSSGIVKSQARMAPPVRITVLRRVALRQIHFAIPRWTSRYERDRRSGSSAQDTPAAEWSVEAVHAPHVRGARDDRSGRCANPVESAAAHDTYRSAHSPYESETSR